MLVIQAPQKKPSVHQRILRQSTIGGVAMIALFGGTIGLWAATSTLSGAVVAGGQFVVDTSVKKVQHPTGGIVGELRVQEGDRVSRGRSPGPPRRDGDPRQPAGRDEAARRVSRPPGTPRGRARRDGHNRNAGGVRRSSERAGRSEDRVVRAHAVRSPAAPPARRRRTSSRSASPSPRTRSWD